MWEERLAYTVYSVDCSLIQAEIIFGLFSYA